MSSDSWFTSLSCSINPSQSSFATNLLKFIFLSPCPQRLIFSSINLFFLLILLVFSLKKLCSGLIFNGNSISSIDKPLLRTENPKYKAEIRFKLSLLAASLLAVSCSVLCVLTFIQGLDSPWKLTEALFRLVQSITYVSIVVLMLHEMKFGVVVHRMLIRAYWVANSGVVCLFAVSAMTRLVCNREKMDFSMRLDDVWSLISLPLSIFLSIIAIGGKTGIIIVEKIEFLEDSNRVESNVSGYSNASLLSRATWHWMNPLLNKGYKSPLKIDEVPSLSPDHRAEKMAELFEKNWPSPSENSENLVITTLARCFWKDIAFTGFLAIVRLGVMYVGPVLIQGFVDFTSNKNRNPYEGYYLILTLLFAKIVEVLSSHQFNFHSQKLGMLIRSTVITGLYRKGLRLSCSSRQAHGVGQIVNYMAVDAQQLSDMMMQMHSLWMMPLQVGVALALLYGYIGVSTLAAFFAVFAALIFTLIRTRRNNLLQFNVMTNRDLRMKATNEMLGNMRVIKFHGWEEYFGRKIRSFRGYEFGWLSKFMYSISCNMVVLWSAPVLVAALTFAVAIWRRVPLGAGTVFTATTILRILQEPIQAFPQALISISQTMISLGRLDRYLTSRELEGGAVEREGSGGRGGGVVVEVKDGGFSWDDEGGEEVLRDVRVEIKRGELAAIVGTVGSGKSSLLASILGELHKISGKVRVCGTTAYVSQSSWIQNATIQENILFGSSMDKDRYKEVIRVCCLEKDFEIMENSDQTEIGERGINLSGGQKQRIQLARAIYQDCDIYLLDDIFSAVDAHTGSEIFKECVRGALKEKTVLLVTHQVDFLHNADLILVMREGKIVQSGKYEDLLNSGTDFRALVAAHDTSMELVGMSTAASAENFQKQPPNISASQTELNGENNPLDRSEPKKSDSKLIEDEERETGHVSFEVYGQYCTEAYGWWGVLAVILMSILWQLSLMSSDYWLAYETSDNSIFRPSLFINVYSIIALVSCVVVLIRSFLVTFLGLKTAQSFFDQIVHSITHAPMSFFDTTPSGRILSRASTDQANVDFLIPLFLSMTLVMYFSLLGVVVITCQYAWPTVFLIIPMVWLNIWYRGYYISSSRELTRLDSITRAPVIHHFSETISGVMTIRCFGKQNHFFKGNVDRVNANLRMDFHNNASNEWLGFRLEMIGSFFLCVAAMFMVLLPSTIIQPEYVGLSLSYGLGLNGVLFWTVYISCNVENRMVSVERIKQFIKIPSEAAWKIPGALPSPDWPSCGNIEIKDLQVRYRPNTPTVLKGITVSIRGGEKIGVVGRTGSGKSTLIQVFFRLVEPSSGKIIIDDVDICQLGLHDLRSRFGIIPQDPVLFQGTVRSNIDPVGLYSDEDIWKSLERCQLKEVVASKPEKLNSSVVDSGDNWSVGQRQLLCLGRVMLKHSKILFMDEATASVDSQTDSVIQKIIREDFSTCTIISIAHRIPTVIDCDRVLVIDNGWAKEFDTPSNLLERPSLFGALVQEYANRSSGF